MGGSEPLPVLLSNFIGRESEITELMSLIERARLVTVTGLGGSGKSRLVLALAQRVAPTGGDGVWWVPLARVTNPDGITHALAKALHVPTIDDRAPMSTLLARLGSSRALLICDTCEHLGDAVVEVIEDLLLSCPNLRVLATSQRRLGVPGEVTWLVPPLSGPTAPELDADTARFEAVRLFVDRARSVLPRFDPDRETIAMVATVCRRLEGLPLAIELAAVRVRVLSVQQIAARLDDALELLVGGNRTTAPRHRSLRATLNQTIYPDGVPRPDASNTNWTPGQTVQSFVLASAGSAGAVDLYNGSGGRSDLVVDLFGCFADY